MTQGYNFLCVIPGIHQWMFVSFIPVLRIRDVYPRSDFFLSRIRCLPSQIPGPSFFHSGSQIQDDKIPDTGSGSTSKKLSIFNSKIRSRNVHPRSRIPYPGSGFFHSASRIQGSKKYRIPDPDPQHCFLLRHLTRSSWNRTLFKDKNILRNHGRLALFIWR
jgi:hypothetical protein